MERHFLILCLGVAATLSCYEANVDNDEVGGAGGMAAGSSGKAGSAGTGGGGGADRGGTSGNGGTSSGTGGTGGTLPVECCSAGDPCGYANDLVCECNGAYAWDDADCASEPVCCSLGDPCGYASDGVCDCSGAYAWDDADCLEVECCSPADLCGYANDLICDCNGAFSWDDADCNVGGEGGAGGVSSGGGGAGGVGGDPSGWNCDLAYFDDGLICDCGCGEVDPDCASSAVESCDYCFPVDAGGCNEVDVCPGTIDPLDNGLCQ